MEDMRFDTNMGIGGINLPTLDFHSMLKDMFGVVEKINIQEYIPDRILKSGNATIVFWNDGTKTIVKLPEGDKPDDYSAFTAALAKKIFGSNSKVKKVIKTKTEIQKPKVKKGEEDEIIPVSADGVTSE